ncbi:hypothetical protein HDU83_009805 [Entophlyctis luteolus]|nr:hypothetical protein HDU83_009805 [Entophlyctis luteolus]
MDLNLDADLDTLLSTLHPPWTADAGIRTRIEDLHRVNPGSTDTGNTGSLNNESNATTSATKRSKTSPNIHPENVPAAPPVAASPTSAPVAPSSMDRERVSNQQNATPSSSAPTDSTSFPEMIYVTDELGNILTLKDPETWNVWLSRNCSSNVSPARMERSRCPTVVGRNLFEYIADVKVASFTRHIIYMLGSEQQDSFK